MSNIIKVDFQGAAISFDERGWFNATVAAAKFGRRVDHWLKTRETKGYIAALCEISNTPKKGYLRTRRGNEGGTWLHPKLAVVFARWLDVRFAVWCDEQIDTILRTSIVPAPTIYEQIMVLQVASKTTAAKATVGSGWMTERKLALRSIRPKLSALEKVFQQELALSA